jgi:hypothetical protein
MGYDGFWRTLREENRRAILQDYGVINKVWYLFPQGGGPRGSFETFADLSPNLRSRDLIYLSGVLREQVQTPVGVLDVTILGAANKPRQATSGGVPTGGGASWLAPTTPVALTPLLSIIEQGWSIRNIQMAPVAGAPCLWFRRQESVTIPDASHFVVSGCFFSTGGAAGIGIAVGECSYGLIENNDFMGLGTGIGYVTDGGFAIGQYRHIVGNRFRRGTLNDIMIPGTNDLIENNVFQGLFATEGGWRINLDGGAAGCMVLNNYVADVDTTIALGFKKSQAADIWRNFVATVVDPKVVVPA